MAVLLRFLQSLSDKRNRVWTIETTQATIAHPSAPTIIFLWAERTCEERKRAHTMNEVHLRRIREDLRDTHDSHLAMPPMAVPIAIPFYMTRWSPLRYWWCEEFTAAATEVLWNDTTLNTDFLRLLMGRVQDSGAAITDRTIHDYHCHLSPFAPDWTTGSDRCEEREPSGPTLFDFVKQVNESWSPTSEYGCAPYDGIRRGFLWLQWWCFFVAGILRIHGATGWTVWALSDDQRIQHVFKAREGSIDVSYPHVGMDSI